MIEILVDPESGYVEVWSDRGLSNYYALWYVMKLNGCVWNHGCYVCRPINLAQFLRELVHRCKYYRLICRVRIKTEKGISEYGSPQLWE